MRNLDFVTNLDAVTSYDRALGSGQRPTIRVIVEALKLCSSNRDLKTGQRIHRQLMQCGDCKDLFVLSSLVDMYAKCGSMDYASSVFEGMQHRSIVTWNCIIMGYAKNGEARVALNLFFRMRDEAGYAPTRVTLLAALKACAELADAETRGECLERGKTIHLEAATSGCEMDIFVASALVDMYAKCGAMEDARRVFERMPHRDAVLWNCLISGYVEDGEIETALDLFSTMRCEGRNPNALTFVGVLKACVCLAKQESAQIVQGQRLKVESLQKGREVHALIVRLGCELDRFVASSLVEMYAKCGSMADARSVFDRVPRRDAVLWTGMILGYAENGEAELALQLYLLMHAENGVDAVATVAALKACAALACEEEAVLVEGKLAKTSCQDWGEKIHAIAVEFLHETNRFVANSLVDMYAKVGCMDKARDVFERTPSKDVVCWTSIILGYVESGEALVALDLYERMQKEGFVPDKVTIIAALKACASLAEVEETKVIEGKMLKSESLKKGRSVHSLAVLHYGDVDDSSDRILLDNTLLDMYAKCGSMAEARRTFENLQHPDIISWNCMIMGYAVCGESESALDCYEAMRRRGLKPTPVTFIAACKACASLAEVEVARLIDGKFYKPLCLEKGRHIHAHAQESGRYDETDCFVANTLVDMYGKCGSMPEAWNAFVKMPYRDRVSWNCLLMGLASNGEGQAALTLYFCMRDEARITADAVTFVATLKACGSVGDLETGRLLHSEAEELGFGSDPMVLNSLVDFYGKCGSMEDAVRVFETIPTAAKCLVSWNTLLSGYSRHGDTWNALALFERLRREAHPDAITFQSVLSACSHAGLVEVGKAYFQMMSSEYGIVPEIEHYICMVDLLGRANMLEAAVSMVKCMPYEPNRMVWMALLGACRKWKNVEVARIAYEEAIKLDDGHAPAYVLMANICACAGVLNEVQAPV